MEEQTNPSNDTAEQTIPKQETTLEEEETSPPQDTSADPLTQIADALSKLLVARSPREIDVSPYDGTFEAQSFFDNFDAQADRTELTYTDRLRKLPCYLQENYYQNKTVMGMKLDLPADILIESLTDGLPVADQRLVATVQPNTIKEWFDLVDQVFATEDLMEGLTSTSELNVRFLTNEQKLCRLATSEDMLEMTRTDPEWKDKIITGDETWVYGYDPETKRQTAEWRGQGQTVIKEMYLGILRRLREAIRKKSQKNGLMVTGSYTMTMPALTYRALGDEFLAKNRTQILPQPPYSPDIAPNDFFLFPKLKAVLKGRHFDTRDDIIKKSLLALKSIPKEAYKNCFDNWKKRWR
ncbi:hypothetical protein LAZ67_10002815 [Cordylochernes scorpioides]|uniref:Transposase n=1 Tax=Cordylochernes scorpioides TaxID=51811 RepID=A0ABY6KWU9_9ARAC|nr:hypothetical protein LAZ67_10002815 [Cordylochernes scorpioides]